MSVLIFILLVIFCFKQKTAYEMRISDWSSDVCSSDLLRLQQLPLDRRWKTLGRANGAESHEPGFVMEQAADFLHRLPIRHVAEAQCCTATHDIRQAVVGGNRHERTGVTRQTLIDRMKRIGKMFGIRRSRRRQGPAVVGLKRK